MAPQTRRCCGLVVTVLGEALSEEIVGKFASLFKAIDSLFNDKVNPTMMIEARKIVLVDESLRNVSGLDFDEFRPVKRSPQVEVGNIKACETCVGSGEHAVELEFDEFKGSTMEMVSYAMQSWWHKIGNTTASGITKLVTSEASNFPDVVKFYETEVMQPGQTLFKKILQRGIDSGEFKPFDTDTAVYSLVSVIFFLSMWKHSLSACMDQTQFNPETFLQSHVQALMHGWLTN